MKCKLFFGFYILAALTANNSISGQGTNPYRSSWEDQDLSGNTLPVIMPYNRIIDPAGEQIYFGNWNLENHALDCALSPDKMTLAIEGRYRVLFYNIEAAKIIYELSPATSEYLWAAENTYSGIKWYRRRGRQYVFWSLVSSDTLSYVFMAEWDGQKAAVTRRYSFKAEAPARLALPRDRRNKNGTVRRENP